MSSYLGFPKDAHMSGVNVAPLTTLDLVNFSSYYYQIIKTAFLFPN